MGLVGLLAVSAWKMGCGGDIGLNRRQMLVVGITNDVATFNPLFKTSAVEGMASGLLFLPLARSRGDGTMAPQLAERWRYSDDFRTLTLYLRQDVRWTDGTPTTARDLKFALDTIRDPRVGSRIRGLLSFVDTVIVIDDYTVQVNFKELRYDPMVFLGGIEALPSHILGPVAPTELQNADFRLHPIGNGPFKLAFWNPEERFELIPNEDYYRGAPALQRLVLRVIPNRTVQVTELRSGGIDMIWQMASDDYPKVKDDNRFQIYTFTGTGYTYLGWNLRRSLWQDRQVRQALTMAIDRWAMIKVFNHGFGQVLVAGIQPESWAYHPHLAPYPYDLEAARRLLAAAGWQDRDGDGWLDRDGQSFSFELLVSTNSEDRAVFIQDQLAKVGVQARVRLIEFNVMSQRVRAGEFDACLRAWVMAPNYLLPEVFYSKRIGQYNYGAYVNPELDRLIEKGLRTPDRRLSKPIWNRFQEIVHRDQPYTFLYTNVSFYPIHNRFRSINPKGFDIFSNIEAWQVAE